MRCVDRLALKKIILFFIKSPCGIIQGHQNSKNTTGALIRIMFLSMEKKAIINESTHNLLDKSADNKKVFITQLIR